MARTTFQVKMYKAHQSRTTLGSWDVEKVTFQVKMVKAPHDRTTFGRSDDVLRGTRKGVCTLSIVSKAWGFCSSFNYNYNCTTLHYTYNYNHHNYNYANLHYTTLNSLQYTTLNKITLDYYTSTIQLQIHYTIYTTPQLQLHYITTATAAALHHTTSSSCGWSDHCNHCNHSKKTTPTTFQSISGFALPPVNQNNQPLL